MRYEFTPPARFEDFQRLCKALWAAEWRSTGAEEHGRNGSKQAGVDCYARLPNRGGWQGVQCKKKQRWPARKLTLAEVEEEADKARAFEPPLKHLIVATTANRDANLQREVRLLNSRNARNKKRFKFHITVASWDEILDLLNDHLDVAQRFYPHIKDIPPTWQKRAAQALRSDAYDLFFRKNGQELKLVCRDADIIIYAQKGKFSFYFLRGNSRSTSGYALYPTIVILETADLVKPLLKFFDNKPESFYYHFEEPARINGSIKIGDVESGFEHFVEDSPYPVEFDNQRPPEPIHPEGHFWVLRNNIRTVLAFFTNAQTGAFGHIE